MDINQPAILIPLTVGGIFIVTGFLLNLFPPKKINHLFGYRSKNSMQSQERWNFAQTYSAKLMMLAGLLLFPCMGLTLLESLGELQQMFIVLGWLIILVIFLFVKTEKAIKNKFS